jgi:hypothetical protein
MPSSRTCTCQPYPFHRVSFGSRPTSPRNESHQDWFIPIAQKEPAQGVPTQRKPDPRGRGGARGGTVRVEYLNTPKQAGGGARVGRTRTPGAIIPR